MKRRAPVISTSMTATSDKKTSSVAPTATTTPSSIMKFSRTSFYDKISNTASGGDVTSRTTTPVRLKYSSQPTSSSVSSGSAVDDEIEHKDELNYVLLIALYTLQGIPMGLSASIPFLIQQKIRLLASSTTQNVAE
jgi:Acetyl-coenzyme A transporter 1